MVDTRMTHAYSRGRPWLTPLRAIRSGSCPCCTGIAVDTLRVWERRYAVVKPVRNDRGRLYSDGDIQRLQLLAAAVAEGYGIGRVAQLADSDLQRLAQPPDAAPTEVGLERRTDDSDRILRALRGYDAVRVDRELSQLSMSMTPRALVCGVMRPLLTRIGDEWQSGRITVAQEHLLSASLRSVLGHAARRSPGASGPRLLFATPSGERHEFGILGAAILAAGAGCRVVYLGSDLPAADIIDAAIRSRAHTVVLGLIYEDAMRTALADVRRIADRLSDIAKVCVGGVPAAAASRAVQSAGATLLPDFEAFETYLAQPRTPADRARQRHGTWSQVTAPRSSLVFSRQRHGPATYRGAAGRGPCPPARSRRRDAKNPPAERIRSCTRPPVRAGRSAASTRPQHAGGSLSI